MSTVIHQFTWTDPNTNVDGTPIAAGEITGYNLGFRMTNAAGTVAGKYTQVVSVPGAAAASELLTAIAPALAPGPYAAAVQAVGPVNSAWSPEINFTVSPPTPSAPAGFTFT